MALSTSLENQAADVETCPQSSEKKVQGLSALNPGAMCHCCGIEASACFPSGLPSASGLPETLLLSTQAPDTTKVQFVKFQNTKDKEPKNFQGEKIEVTFKRMIIRPEGDSSSTAINTQKFSVRQWSSVLQFLRKNYYKHRIIDPAKASRTRFVVCCMHAF